MNTLSNLPGPAVPLVGADGRLAPAWLQFFMALFARTGGAPGIAASDTQADTSGGTPIVDLAPVYAMLYAVEAMAAQAMATGSLLTRIAELEARIDVLGQPIWPTADFEAQLAAGAPVPAGYLADGDAIGSINPNTGSFTTLRTTGGVGIGAAPSTYRAIQVSMPLTGNVSAAGVFSNPAVQPDVTNVARGYVTQPSLAAGAFTLASLHHYQAIQGAIGAGAAITVQSGFNADASITGAATNYGFLGSVPAGANNWNFYAATTAKNYLGGTTLIGSSADDGSGNKLQVSTALSIAPATTTTAPAAGTAEALPATPSGYATFRINGTNRLIPYY